MCKTVPITRSQLINLLLNGKRAIDIANKNADKARKLNKTTYDRKLCGIGSGVCNRVLLRHNSERGGTGKLRSHWEDITYIVIKKQITYLFTTSSNASKIIALCTLLPAN